MEKLGKLVTGIFLFVIALCIDGFILMKMWLWFIVPTFNLAPLAFNKAIGLSLFIWLVLKSLPKKDDDDFWDMLGTVFYKIVTAFILLGLSWIVYLFIK